MLSQPTTIRPASQDLMTDLRLFIGGATKINQVNSLELVKIALNLLKNLPAARDAVLEYFCTVFDKAASNYVKRIETEVATGELPPNSEYDETTIMEIHNVLCSYVSANADAWAPIISTWSLELLGEISTRYARRAHISTGLNETLQLWMSCRATRTLIDITTQCLSCLMNSNTEACISALLDTSVKHSPNFDWVVAHVGSCFPNTVITRVLSCGLKDFCQNKSYEQGADSPKLKSVVGILGHLAGSHCDDIRTALLNLFKWSIEISFKDPDDVQVQKKAAVPFLLQLSNLSSTLLTAACKDIRDTITLHVITILYGFIDDWCKYFGSPEALESLLVNLILKCECSGAQIISLLLDCIFMENIESRDPQMKQTIQLHAKEMLECVLQEIALHIRNKKPQDVDINLLKAFVDDLEEFHEILLSPDKVRSETAARILIFIGHVSPPKLIDSATFLFQKAKTDHHLAILVRILTDALIDQTIQPYADKGGYFSVVFEQILNRDCDTLMMDEDIDFCLMWQNLLKLLKWEKSDSVEVLKCHFVSRAIQNNLINLTAYYTSDAPEPILHIISEILDILNLTYNDGLHDYSPPIDVILNLTNGTIKYFFICCKLKPSIQRLHAFRRVCDLIKNLSEYSRAVKILAIKELLERVIFSADNVLFGATIQKLNGLDKEENLLLHQNRRINKTIPLTKHSSVYNGGIIGNGKRKPPIANNIPPEIIASNTKYLLKVLRNISMSNEMKKGKVFMETLIEISLQLVQFISPDVMYNGLPWPEEEFSKVTIERDLYITKLFGTTPILWDLLSFLAVNRPAFCFCSVLIRAITATVIHQWNSMGSQSKSNETESYKSLMETTIKVIDVMSLGQFLPPPLSSIRDVIPYLESKEIVSILRECIWAYLHDNIPSPALFTADSNNTYWRDPIVSRPPEVYTNTLRIIMQRNIETVGHLFSEMFINIPKS